MPDNDYDYDLLHVAKENGTFRLYERRRGRIITDAHGRPRGVVPQGDYSYRSLTAFKTEPSDRIVPGWVLVPVEIKD